MHSSSIVSWCWFVQVVFDIYLESAYIFRNAILKMVSDFFPQSNNIFNIFRKDDNWKLSRGAYMFIIIGLLLLLGAISAIIVTIKPWAVSDHPMCCSFHVQNSYLTLFVCFSFPFCISTDRGCIPSGASPSCSSYWCYSLLGV